MRVRLILASAKYNPASFSFFKKIYEKKNTLLFYVYINLKANEMATVCCP
jgi:hypothetical protein